MPFLVIYSWLASVFVLPILCCNNISHLKALMLIPMNVLRILAQRRFFYLVAICVGQQVFCVVAVHVQVLCLSCVVNTVLRQVYQH